MTTHFSQLLSSTWGLEAGKTNALKCYIPEYCRSVHSGDFNVSTFFSFHWGLGMAEGVSRSRQRDIGRVMRGKAWHCDMSGCNHCSQSDLPRNQIHLVIKKGNVKANWHLSFQLRKGPPYNHARVYIYRHTCHLFWKNHPYVGCENRSDICRWEISRCLSLASSPSHTLLEVL